MPTPTPSHLEQLQHLPMADQLAWLDRRSTALLEGQEPPSVPSPSREPG
jgi:hypothetical protein